MKQYYLLQSKRLWRYLPAAILVVVLLLGGLAAVLNLLLQQQSSGEQNTKFRVGIVGSTEDPFLQMGMGALTSYDSSRLSMELLEMTQEDAARDMALGRISAYVVIPENFIQEAFYGRILPLKFVSTVGATGMIAIFQTEITDTISQILLDAQKGVYGMASAATDNGIRLNGHMDRLSLEFAEYVFIRDKTYRVTELGISEGLDFTGSLVCGFAVLFVLLSCLPFAPLMIHRDIALAQMMAARGRSVFRQTLCDFGAYAVALLAMLVSVAVAAALAVGKLGQLLPVLLQSVPAVVLAAALSYMLYSLSTDLIGGILLQFFATLSLCLVSGCLYPAYFFPSALQQAAAWLPTGVARSQIANAIAGSGNILTLAVLVGYSVVFFLVGSFVTCRRIREVHR